MDQSHSESDVSLSPSQILQRLQALRQLQLMQRGKLQKQRLEYQETTETSSSITEIVSQFSNSTCYNTFRSLLQSPQDSSNNPTRNSSSQQVKEQDLIEGVSVLNLSQESEFIINSPISSRSRGSATSRNDKSPINTNIETKSLAKKQISLDEMPILSPKQDFEALIIEKLKTEMVPKVKIPKKENVFAAQSKKPFLRRGEGMSRFGIKKNDLVIQNTKSLPWRRKCLETKTAHSPVKPISKKTTKNNKNVEIEIIVTEPNTSTSSKNTLPMIKPLKEKTRVPEHPQQQLQNNYDIIDSSNCEIHCANANRSQNIQSPKEKHPISGKKGKTWAAVLTKEQDDFLRQLKQSDYYKNFVSPAKSIVSDFSCDDNHYKLRQERETAEQNMFELLENKVSHESFNLENSFFDKFLKRNNLECSGESTPLIMQRCLANNPALMHIFPDLMLKNRNRNSVSEADTCNSEYTDCCSSCSCASSCSCKTVEEVNESTQSCIKNIEVKRYKEQKGPTNKHKSKEVEKVTETQCQSEKECHNDTVTENDTMKANMAEMNAKLVATSELLKDRLRELEDEIETFRKENMTLSKLREEVDLERQKFYEEKSSFEQKFNEEKILSEYYLAEEKEKLTKQKQMYERYVREMRGRLNKKEKDEVINLRKEINDLKEEIRLKDAKSTSTIARLRNQVKIMEKEKKNLEDDLEKLKKENRRIQHCNDITRRLTNMKYLEEINKKLSKMSSKETKSEVQLDNDAKYKAYEIERQSRSRKVQPVAKGTTRPRAKSVPNLNVTSRYAKYFSQRDAVSQMDRDLMHMEQDKEDINRYHSDNDTDNNDNVLNGTESVEDSDLSDKETGNHLEKMYRERFQSTSPTSNRSNLYNPATSIEKNNFKSNPDGFFIRKSSSSSTRDSNSPVTSPYLQISNGSGTNRTKSSILTNTSNVRQSPSNGNKEHIPNSGEYTQRRPKSPLSILSNRSSNSRLTTVINQDQYRDKLLTVSPEPSTSKTSLTKTNLNPTEIKKPDGTKELRFPNGNVKYVSADGKYSKFVYYNGDVKENFLDEGRIKYFYAEAKTFHTTHADGLEVLEFPDGQVEKRYKDGSTEIRLPNGSIRYFDPKNEHVREEWRFPDGTALTVSASGEQRVVFGNGQVEVHAKDHKRREFPDGTVKLVYNDGTSETRYASGRVRVKDKQGHLIMDSAPG